MSDDQLVSGVIPETTSVISVTLMPSPDREDQWGDWLMAFRKCHQYTLCSLSFPSHSGTFLAHGRNVDLELDTHRSVRSILASGLPLPKSPSIQIDEVDSGLASDTTEQEREERGWWSLRFQQVLRELQRQETPLFSPLEPQAPPVETEHTRNTQKQTSSAYTPRDTYSSNKSPGFR